MRFFIACKNKKYLIYFIFIVILLLTLVLGRSIINPTKQQRYNKMLKINSAIVMAIALVLLTIANVRACQTQADEAYAYSKVQNQIWYDNTKEVSKDFQ